MRHLSKIVVTWLLIVCPWAASARSEQPPQYERVPGPYWQPPVPPVTRQTRELNALLAEVRDRATLKQDEQKVILKEEVLRHINWTWGNGRELNLLKDARRLPWPGFFENPSVKADRARVDALVPRAGEQVKKGKVQETTLKELGQATERLNEELVKQVGNVSPSEYIKARRFLVRLVDLAESLKEPDADKYYRGIDQFTSRDRTVRELVVFMTETKLQFAPPAAADAEAYKAVRRALRDLSASR